ncbi:hypothetical protein ATANTOWER_013186 [Ataeniobius toweri]|uniref:Uncharacterized protein n=1 Tax=Ataeniobius toweri TaxID=208326 RepID=A0ABU7AJ41_9TELE|nr:hypothetical protein [Ataeniobius toweri]
MLFSASDKKRSPKKRLLLQLLNGSRLSRIISLPRIPLSSKPSKRPIRPRPLGQSTNGTAARGHMTRTWRLSTCRSQRQADIQTDCNVKQTRPELCLCMDSDLAKLCLCWAVAPNSTVHQEGDQ